MLGALALALGSHARAESNIIPPDQAEVLVRAQIEEQKVAAEALKEEEAALEASEGAKPGKAAKTADKKRTKEVAAPAPIAAKAKVNVPAPAEADDGIAEQTAAEETASISKDLPVFSRSERVDAVKAGALKSLIVQYASQNGVPYELADAVIRLESRYNSGARRGANVGLTQINVRTARSLGYKGDA